MKKAEEGPEGGLSEVSTGGKTSRGGPSGDCEGFREGEGGTLPQVTPAKVLALGRAVIAV